MSNKDKLLASAQKHADKNNLSKAIRDYKQALELDQSDTRVRLKLGDLQAKAGDEDGAIVSYRIVARQYTAAGYLSKAAAMYKRVLKSAPRDADATLALGEVYNQLGRLPDAMACFSTAAEIFRKNKDTARFAETMHTMVGLDPSNVGIRIKLAEYLSKKGANREAFAEFSAAADLLLNEGRTEDFAKVTERLLFLNPDDPQRTLALVHAYRELGDPRKALAKLQPLFQANPRDVAILGLLAEIFIDLDQTPKALQVLREKARTLARDGQQADAAQQWRAILDLDPSDAEAQAALAASQPAAPPPVPAAPPVSAATSAPPPTPGASSPPPVPSAGGPPPGLYGPLNPEVERLLVETDVYIKYGLNDQAIDHLKRILLAAPNHVEAIERLKTVHYQAGSFPQAVEELLKLARLCQPHDWDRAVSYLREALQVLPNSPPARALMQAWGIAWEQLFPPPEVADVDLEALALLEGLDGFDGLDGLDDMISEIADQPQETTGSDALDNDQALTGQFSIERLQEHLFEGEDPDEDVFLDDLEELEPVGDLDDLDDVDSSPYAALHARPTNTPSTSTAAVRRDAAAVAPALDARNPADFVHRAPTSVYEQSNPSSSQSVDVFDPPAVPNAGFHSTYDVSPSSLPEQLSHDLAQCDLYVQHGELEQAEDSLNEILKIWPNHPEVLTRLEHVRQLLYAPSGSVPAAPAPAPDTPQYDGGSPYPEPVHTGDAMDPRFELGLAFRRIGKYQDAVQEFQAAAHDGPHVDLALFWLAQCYFEAGDFAEAANLYIHASQYAVENPELMHYIYYWLGIAYEQVGHYPEALECFQHVQTRADLFGDVHQRIQALAAYA